MIVCANCSHQNPDGAVQCEACYTPLPATTTCPNCGSSVQADASFCGQCGFNLQAAKGDGTDPAPIAPAALPTPIGANPIVSAPISSAPIVPATITPDPLVPPDPIPPDPIVPNPTPAHAVTPDLGVVPAPIPPAPSIAPQSAPANRVESRTQLQQQTVRLLHVQTSTALDFPQGVNVIHIGKPNDRIPPDVDVSGFPNSEIVSRIHADIRIEGDAFYLEDVGSSNGTYINNTPLPMGNRHRLRSGDRIALGKGDKMTFLFQMS